jgi:hypothetical protein
MPAHESSAKTPLTDDHPCERQEPPNLQSQLGNAPTGQSTLSRSATSAIGDQGSAFLDKLKDRLTALNKAGAGDEELLGEVQRMLGRIGLSPDEAAGLAGLGGEGG